MADFSAIQELKSKNNAFVTDYHYNAQRQALKDSQHPHTIVVSCADSRVPPEIIFNSDALGSLFVVRTAGHVVDEGAYESIKYAATNIKPQITRVVVIGHEGCGAVKAAYESVDNKAISDAFPTITGWLHGVINTTKSINPQLKVRNALTCYTNLHV